MHLGLDGKVIFIAGASRGIGLGIVEACLAEGAKLAITARGAEALEAERARLAQAYGEDRLIAIAGDMRDTAVIEDAVARTEDSLGPIFGAVANVGLYPCPPGIEVDDETWDQGFAQNLDSAWRLSRAVLRRMDEGATKTYEDDHLNIDFADIRVVCDGRKIKLTNKEFSLLSVLAKSADRVVTRQQLLDNVWGYSYYGDARTLDVHIRRLRQKLEECGNCIETVVGVGYRFTGCSEKPQGT